MPSFVSFRRSRATLDLLLLIAGNLAWDGAVFAAAAELTAYYSESVENHQRYHMGVAVWQGDESGRGRGPRVPSMPVR